MERLQREVYSLQTRTPNNDKVAAAARVETKLQIYYIIPIHLTIYQLNIRMTNKQANKHFLAI